MKVWIDGNDGVVAVDPMNSLLISWWCKQCLACVHLAAQALLESGWMMTSFSDWQMQFICFCHGKRSSSAGVDPKVSLCDVPIRFHGSQQTNTTHACMCAH